MLSETFPYILWSQPSPLRSPSKTFLTGSFWTSKPLKGTSLAPFVHRFEESSPSTFSVSSHTFQNTRKDFFSLFSSDSNLSAKNIESVKAGLGGAGAEENQNGSYSQQILCTRLKRNMDQCGQSARVQDVIWKCMEMARHALWAGICGHNGPVPNWGLFP